MERKSNSNFQFQRLGYIFRYLLSIFSVSLIDVASSYDFLVFLLFICYVFFIYAIKNTSFKNTFFIGMVHGIFLVIFFMWPIAISEYKLFLVILVLKGIQFGIMGIFFEITRRYVPKILYSFTIAAIGIFIEWLSTISPYLFPSHLALPLYKNLSLIQIASVTGIYGVSFVVILINGLTYQIIESIRNLEYKKAWHYAVISGGILLIINLFGFVKLNNEKELKKNELKIAIIQGGLPQWVYEAVNFSPLHAELMINTYLFLIKQAIKKNVALVICPESCIILPFLNIKRELFKLASSLNGALLIGLLFEKNGKLFNSALCFYKKKLIDIYSKNYLLVFTEKEFTPGSENNTINLPFCKIGVVICYESLYPQKMRKYTIKDKADILAILTNDASFGRTKISYLHAAAAVFRAIENRRFVVRAAQSGVSMVVSPTGKILKFTKLFEPTVVFSTVYLQNSYFSIYSIYGDWFVYLCIGTIIFIVGIIFFKRRILLC